VHGFNGNPERTWTFKTGPGDTGDTDFGDASNASSSQKLTSDFQRMRLEDKDKIFWPGQLLPHCVPEARILTFGYDSKVRPLTGPNASTESVLAIGRDFLNALEAGRRQCTNRPIFFIAHSLGGIIVKEMLRQSHFDYCHEKASGLVYTSTIGVIFFGTPHAGAKPGGSLFNPALTMLKLYYKANDKLIDSLMPNSERLEELKEAFAAMAQGRQWKIHSFQEGRGIAKLRGAKVNNHY
jgi:hypothetical protein